MRTPSSFLDSSGRLVGRLRCSSLPLSGDSGAMEGRTNEAVADLHKALLAEANEEPLLGRSGNSAPTQGNPSAVAGHLKSPGGFRRDFLHSRAEADGVPMDERPQAWRTLATRHPNSRTRPVR